MAFTTSIQQVLAYLKAGHPILPTSGLPQQAGPAPVSPFKGTMPTAPPPKAAGGA